MNQDITVFFDEQAGSLDSAHIVVCIDTAYVLIFSLNGHDGNVEVCKLFGGERLAYDNQSFNIVGEEFLKISAYSLLIILSYKNQKFVAEILIGQQKLV